MKEVVTKVNTLLKSSTVRGTVIVSLGSFGGSLFSYALQVTLGWKLSIEEFGIFNTLLSLAIILALPSGAIQTALVKTVSKYLAKNDFDTLTRLFKSFSVYALAIGVILGFLIFISQGFLGWYLKLTDESLLFFFGLYIAFSFLHLPIIAFLQGLLRFKAYSFFMIISQLFRFLIPLVFVIAGFKIYGALSGMAISTIIGYIIGYALLYKHMIKTEGISYDTGTLRKEVLSFSAPAFIAILYLNLMNNIDVILVKHLFSEYDTGIYSGALTMAKVLLFGAGTVQIIMFPQIANAYERGHYVFGKFVKFLGLQIALLSCGMFIYSLFPHLINQIMFMGKYTSSVSILPLFALFISLYVLIGFFIMFLLAISKTRYALFLLLLLGLQIVLIYNSGHTLKGVLNANILSAGLAIIILAGYISTLALKIRKAGI